MKRKIIKINEEKCNDSGAYATACHEGAISFEEREAPAYNEAAVLVSKQKNVAMNIGLNHWPVQINLTPINTHYFEECNLLVAADCTSYAHANFHNEFMHNRVTLIGCPKFDNIDYSLADCDNFDGWEDLKIRYVNSLTHFIYVSQEITVYLK